MMKSFFRHILLVVMAILCVLPSQAVLSEDNIDRTVIMLSADMKVLEQNIRSDLKRFENRQREFRCNLDKLSETCDENGVVLYSQDERYLYGSLQATQNMKNVVGRIKAQKQKLDLLEEDLNTIANRYGELSEFLDEVKSRPLTTEGRKALETSQTIAMTLLIQLQSNIASLDADKSAYQTLVKRADRIEEYNQKTLGTLEKNIFVVGNEPITEWLGHFSSRWQEFKSDLVWRFFTGQSDSDDWNSREDVLYLYLDINGYVAFFVALCFFLITGIKRLCPRRVRGKRIYYSLVLGLLTVECGIAVIRLFMGTSHQFDVLLMIEGELYLIALSIAASSTVRLNRRQIGCSLISYLPIFCLSFLLLEYREDLVPLSTITFTAPFIFLLTLIGQLLVIGKGFRKLDKYDWRMACANLVAIIAGFIVACVGYSVLATMIFLLWIGIVNGFMILALVKSFIARKHQARTSVQSLTMRLFLYPLAYPAILLMAFSWVAHVYNLTSWFGELLGTPFLDMPDRIGVVSIAKLLYIYTLGVCINYTSVLVKYLLRRNEANRQGQVAVWISVGNIVVWLLYVIAVMIILEINRAGLIAAVGGASVGIGFALKDTFENLFSGISLMTGRLRPGDILEYDGDRGKVLNIGIISTTMETEDGPIMAMPNRKLFEKSFKNMTRNHRVEVRHITFDISAENDPKVIRELILNSFRDIDGVDNSRRHVVIIRNFGSGVMRVELKVWIDSEKYLVTEPAVREAVFETFRVHDIRKATFVEQVEAKGSDSIMTNNRTIL